MADDPKQHDLLADASAGLDLKPNKAGSAGHRQRLRQRFLDGGPDALPDYELLELMLFMAMPRVDTKPIAKDLLRTFGSFAEVISAPPESLKQIKGLGDAGVEALKSAQAAAGRLLRAEELEKPILSSWAVSYTHLRAHETKAYHVCRLPLEKQNNTAHKKSNDLHRHTVTITNKHSFQLKSH